MEKLIKKIDEAIEKEAMKRGTTGTEQVRVFIKLTDEEKETFSNIEKYDKENYSYEMDGNELYISYKEDVDDRITLVYEENGETLELGKIFSNHSISIDEALDLLDIDMDDVAIDNGWDGWNYEALKLVY